MTLSTLTLADLDRLYRGFQAITFDEFCAVVRETVGGCKVYAEGVWVPFQDDPLGYCASRRPETQGEALLALAVRKAEEK